MKQTSLASRIFIAVGCVALLTILSISAALTYAVLGPNAAAIDEQLGAAALVVLRSLPSDIDADRAQPFKRLQSSESTSDAEGAERFQVLTNSGRLLLRSADAPLKTMDPTLRLGARNVVISGENWRVVSITDDDHRVIVQYGMPQSDVQTILLESIRNNAILLLAIFFVQLITVLWIVHRALRPLRQLRAALDRRSANDIAHVTVPHLPSEIVPVVASLNGLLSRVEELRDHEQRFLAEAAHELRTPLTAIRLQAQAVARIEDRVQQQQAIEELLGGIDRAVRLSNQMLDFARTESLRNGTITRTSCDVDAIVLAALESIVSPGFKRRSPVTVHGSALIAAVDPRLVELGIRNLVHNALRHAGIDVAVDIRCEHHGDALAIHVHDSGPGVPPDTVADAGLWRSPHRGIGLEIVRRVCALHGGELIFDKDHRPEHAAHRGLQPTMLLAGAFNGHEPVILTRPIK